MFPTLLSSSNHLALDTVVQRLSAAPLVAGIALFGSSTQASGNPVSDYDLLVMLDNPPIHIFQMQTFIDGRIADVAFVETEVADRVLALTEPISATSAEGYLIGWLEQARIIYDGDEPPGRFQRIQHKLTTRDWRVSQLSPADQYAEWFWLNFDLRHIRRMSRSSDLIHLMTVDLRLMACIAGVCRTYFRLHALHWRGEKAALRYFQTHEPERFDLLKRCIVEPDRMLKIELCEQLIARTLRSSGGLWPADTTAAYLKSSAEQPERVGNALALWEHLIQGRVE